LIKVIIFDFDGTIADSVNIKTEAFVDLYKHFGKEVSVKVRDYHLLNGGVSRYEKFKYFHNTFLNIELSKKQIDNMAEVFSNNVMKKVVEAPYIPGAFEFISKNYKKFDMFISTATPFEEILEILQKKRLQKYFLNIFGSPSSKEDHIKKIIFEGNYNKDEIVFIGDSTADKEASLLANIKFIEVCNEKVMDESIFKINNFFNFYEKLHRIK
jgi:phosphoglycolate phosphatase-like HAD superfamily hydrolase